ncbi:hypothetical protein C2845_PM17G06980 [Panicum miliaceum]|uniref:F-box domain-containing protein n=1 Tax=Panicum miliaceum TaxID=4540 RepID=A0A3L6Q3Q0_PANMI|nr:hypothetical protein C2845_PM17G06980 [Panicum miliaceum]
MATTHDWSALPSDLVNRVGDCFLATNDLDHYMTFRAVCSPWRHATDDPRSSPAADPRFWPQRWACSPVRSPPPTLPRRQLRRRWQTRLTSRPRPMAEGPP